MDSSDWFQGMIHAESEIDCSSLSGDMLTCSRPMVERRLRPPQDQAVKCPRCDSTHTKFCYYNNYSLSQPRYFCKACRRYWTKGGTLRNIPVGGGCRKNKKVTASRKPTHEQHSSENNIPINAGSSISSHPTRLHLSFPDQMHLNNVLYNSLLENPMPIDFMGNGELGMAEGVMDYMGDHVLAPNINGLCSPYGMPSLDGNGGSFMDTCQRILLPCDANDDQHGVDVKPNNKLLFLDWKNQGYSDAGKDTYGYINNLGPWSTGVMNIMDPPRQIH